MMYPTTINIRIKGNIMNIFKVLIMSSLLLFFVLPNVLWRKLSSYLYERDPELFSMLG